MSLHLMVCSIVSKGVLPFFKVYFIWPFQEGNVFLGSPVVGAADLVLHQTARRVFSSGLSHQTWVTSGPALSGAKANQVQPGLHSCRKLKYTVTAVTWLLIRSWLGWWQESFSISCQSAKDWYSLGLRFSESQAYVPSGGFSDVLSTLVWFWSPNQRPLSKMLVKVSSTECSFGTSRGKFQSKGSAGKMLSYSSTYRGVLQWL